MANQLKMANVHAIGVLWRQGWSARQIGRALGIHRDTAGRYIRLLKAEAAESQQASDPKPKPANAPPGAGPLPARSYGRGDGSKPANAPIGAERVDRAAAAAESAHDSRPAAAFPERSGPTSGCEPYRAVVLEKLDLGLTARRIWQDLRTEHGFTGSYYCVRRFVGRLKASSPLPFRRMECEPAAEAQVDFGTGAPVDGSDGKRRRTHVFRIVLSHSRKGYSEAVFRQTTDDFIRCLENAFWHFGGIPKTLVIDNLKAAVTRADWFDPQLNPKIQAFCDYYGLAVLPTKPYTPRHKGKVEKGIEYVKSNALKGRRFASLQEENRHLLAWEASVADVRIHGTTRKQVGQVFEQAERPALSPLPLERMAFFHEAPRIVHRDGHVEVAKAYYSVPPEYLGRTVWARWDGRQVRVFNRQMEQIALHPQREPGCFSTLSRHIVGEKISAVERGTTWLLARTRHIGPQTGRWAEAMLESRGVQGVRVLQGLHGLANRYTWDQIEHACEVAESHGVYRLRVIRELIKHQGDKQEQFEFIDEHPIIRKLSEYGAIVRASLAQS